MATNITPLHDRVILKRIEDNVNQTAGGLFIPDTAKEKPQEGEVIAAGAGKYKEDGTRQALVRKLAQDWIAVKQQIHQIFHHLVKGLIVLSLGDDLELELIAHRFVHAQQFEVLRRSQKRADRRRREG